MLLPVLTFVAVASALLLCLLVWSLCTRRLVFGWQFAAVAADYELAASMARALSVPANSLASNPMDSGSGGGTAATRKRAAVP